MVSESTEKGLYNPLQKDFNYEWLDDKNRTHTLTIPSKQIKTFPSSQYEFMRKHLIDFVLYERELNSVLPKNVDDVIREIEAKI